MTKSVALPLPCQTCTYNRIVNEYGQSGCSANKNAETCPKLRRFVAILNRIRKLETEGMFRGYQKKVFGQPVREP